MGRTVAGCGDFCTGVSMKRGQLGVTVIGMVFFGIVAALLIVLVAKVVPTVTEYLAIQQAVNRAAQSGTTVAEIRNAFERAKTADYFDAVSGKDLEISKDGDRIVVEFAYDKEIHLFGPAYLLLKYRGRNS
ncbi:MAG: DUF4845 domain-containing protein [Tepidimonas sp.]